jgi:hypothetical protein
VTRQLTEAEPDEPLLRWPLRFTLPITLDQVLTEWQQYDLRDRIGLDVRDVEIVVEIDRCQ